MQNDVIVLDEDLTETVAVKLAEYIPKQRTPRLMLPTLLMSAIAAVCSTVAAFGQSSPIQFLRSGGCVRGECQEVPTLSVPRYVPPLPNAQFFQHEFSHTFAPSLPGLGKVREVDRNQRNPAIVRLVGRHGVGTGFNIDPKGMILTVAHNPLPKRLQVEIGGRAVRFVGVCRWRRNRNDPASDGPMIYTADEDVDGLPTIDIAPRPAKVGDRVLSVGFIGSSGDYIAMENVAHKIEDARRGTESVVIVGGNAYLPGMSGGPVFNANGQVVGIMSAVSADLVVCRALDQLAIVRSLEFVARGRSWKDHFENYDN